MGRGRGWCWNYFTGYPQPKLEVRPELEEKVQKIYELLPKLDCGACGYSGCYEMAIAIAEGRERPDACRVAGKKIAPLIEDILRGSPRRIEEEVDRIKVLERKIDSLEREIKELKRLIEDLRDRVVKS